MRGLADYIMRRRINAVLFTTVTSVVWILLPPVAHLSGASIGLVALRLGLKEASLVMLSSGSLILLFGAFSEKALPLAASLLIVLLLMFWLPAIILSAVLRTTASLKAMIQAGALVYTVLLLGFYATVGTPSDWWIKILEPMLDFLQEQAGQTQVDLGAENLLEQTAKIMTGVIAATLLLTGVINLLIARWWQAMLYNAGGFAKEFRALRLGPGLAGAFLVLLLASLLGGFPLATDMLFIVGVCFFLQGLSVLHALTAQKNMRRIWLSGLYIVLFLMPQALFAVAVLGLIDNRIDFRNRIGKTEFIK